MHQIKSTNLLQTERNEVASSSGLEYDFGSGTSNMFDLILPIRLVCEVMINSRCGFPAFSHRGEGLLSFSYLKPYYIWHYVHAFKFDMGFNGPCVCVVKNE